MVITMLKYNNGCIKSEVFSTTSGSWCHASTKYLVRVKLAPTYNSSRCVRLPISNGSSPTIVGIFSWNPWNSESGESLWLGEVQQNRLSRLKIVYRQWQLLLEAPKSSENLQVIIIFGNWRFFHDFENIEGCGFQTKNKINTNIYFQCDLVKRFVWTALTNSAQIHVITIRYWVTYSTICIYFETLQSL